MLRLAPILQKEIIPTDELTLAHKKDLQTIARHILRKADNIHIAAVIGDRLLRFVKPLHRLQLVAQARRLLKGIVLRCSLHALLQITLQLRSASIQHHADGLNHLPIFVLAHITGTGRQAALDMVVQAGPIRIHFATGAQGEHAAQQLHRGVHGTGIGIGTVIFGPIPQQAARHIQPWKILLQRHLQIGIGFIVLQADIIAGAIFFDQIAL